MTRGLADTTVFIARESGRRLDEDALPDQISVSVMTVGELRAGYSLPTTWKAATVVWQL